MLKQLFSVLCSRLRQADRRLGSLFAWGLKAHESTSISSCLPSRHQTRGLG